MANAKQYSDLEQAQTVNNTDQFAVAQEGADELKTVTTTQVAERVAGIVSTDQLQEFISDTALGKQVLAQSLANKGVETSATDTLAQMAAKIDPLDVVGATEYLRPPRTIIENGVYPVGSGNYAVYLPYHNVVLSWDNTGSIFTTTRVQNGESEVLSSITVNWPAGVSGDPRCMWSANEKYVAIARIPGYIIVLSMSDGGILSQANDAIKTSFEVSNLNVGYGCLCVSNDGKYAVFGSHSSSGASYRRYDLINVLEETASPLTVDSDIRDEMPCFLLEDNTLLSFYITGKTLYSFYLDKENLTLSQTGGITGVNLSDITFAFEDGIVFQLLRNSSTKKYYDTTINESGTLSVLNARTLETIKSITVSKLGIFGSKPTSATYGLTTIYTTNVKHQFYKEESGKYIILTAGFGKFSYDPVSQELLPSTTTKTYYKGDLVNSLGVYVTYGNAVENGNNLQTALDIGEQSIYSISPYSSGYNEPNEIGRGLCVRPPSQYKYTLGNAEDVIVGIVYKRNGQEIIYRINYIEPEEEAAGAYAIKSTEAVLDITGEGE